MSSRTMNNLVIGIYFHPEAYPPTLNAIGELSRCFDKVTVVHRPHLKGNWKYPANVTTIPSGAYITSANQEKALLLRKILFFFNFTVSLFRACNANRPTVVLVYDSLSLFSYALIKPMLKHHKIWYHNHDVTEPGVLRKYSIGWFAARSESQAFKYLDMFSLPTDERLPYFPLKNFKGQYFFIPNYPAKSFYGTFYKRKLPGQTVRIIFQGSIGPYHGIEEIIPFLNQTVHGHHLELVLKGPCRDEYKQLLLSLAEKNQVKERVIFLGVTPYAEVPIVSASCDIGIGILAKQDIMNTTLGTASNKLYEYAAVGLPVIYYNNINFTRHLNRYAWAIPTEVTSDAIKEKISLILDAYAVLSESAHRDFMATLNFEAGFNTVKQFLKDRILS